MSRQSKVVDMRPPVDRNNSNKRRPEYSAGRARSVNMTQGQTQQSG